MLELPLTKGLFTDFKWGPHGTVVSSSGKRGAIGPIRDTIKSTVAATGFEKGKTLSVNRI